MANINFANALQRLDAQFGLMDVILPFILIFTVIYAVSSSVLHFGKGDNAGNKKLRIVIAFVLAALTVIPHVTGKYQQFDIVRIINESIPQVMMIIVGVVLALILIGSAGITTNPFTNSKWKGGAIILSLLIVAAIFWSNLGGSIYLSNIPILNWLIDPDVQAIALILIVFGGIVYYVTNDESVGVQKARLQDRINNEKDSEVKKVLEEKLNSLN